MALFLQNKRLSWDDNFGMLSRGYTFACVIIHPKIAFLACKRLKVLTCSVAEMGFMVRGISWKRHAPDPSC